ncbi:calcium-binding protein [Falsiroseomonas algicola]|nr:calcium-binding protein [Falsiroseomonas algicola]
MKRLTAADLAQVTGGAVKQGTARSELVFGSAEDDLVFAGDGNDTMAIGAGNDEAYGEAGNDVMLLAAGNDTAFGGTGNDAINGGYGQDRLDGGDGDDLLIGGTNDHAADLALGGAGSDRFTWTPGDGNDEFRGGSGLDSLDIGSVSLAGLLSALRVDGRSELVMRATGDQVYFVDAKGEIMSFSGTITIGSETLRFSEIERIRLV